MAYDTILQKLTAKEFRSYSDVYPYLKKFLIIDLKVLPEEPLAFLEALHRTTANVLPQLSFDSFAVKIVRDKNESFQNFTTYDALVTLTKNGEKYSHKSFYKSVYKNQKAADDRYPADLQSYYQVFNKMFIDQGADFRLHVVSVGDFRFGVLPLKKKQFENLMWSYTGMSRGGYIQLSYENFNPRLTRKNFWTLSVCMIQ